MLKMILNLKSKPLKLSLLVILGFLSFGIFHYNIQLKSVKEMHEPHLSPNSEATEYFMKAMNINLYIRRLHMLFNFDNPLMKPMLALQEAYLNEGKVLLKNETAEYIFFWTTLNRWIYGIPSFAHNKDYSLDPVRLSSYEYKKFNDKLYLMALEYVNLDNDFKYETEYIKGNKFQIADDLVNYFYRMYAYRFDGEDTKSKVIQQLNDEIYTNKLEAIYPLYKEYAKEYLQYGKHYKSEKIDYKITIVGITSLIYFSKQYRLSSSKISKKDCEDTKARDLLENLIDIVSNKSEYKAFHKDAFFSHQVVDMLNKSCENLKDDTQKALALF